VMRLTLPYPRLYRARSGSSLEGSNSAISIRSQPAGFPFAFGECGNAELVGEQKIFRLVGVLQDHGGPVLVLAGAKSP